MYLGRIVEMADTRALYAAPRHPYTQALLAAIPRPQPGAGGVRAVLQGDVPSPTAPPPGCRFHTRCRHAQARCSSTLPAWQDIAGHGVACHFWRDITAPGIAATAAPPNPRLARLQSAFTAAPAA
jgi:oligopeptide/dipeptide ABC transporter ATP-binding protein